MANWLCFLWYLLAGSLLGWLGSWLLGRAARRPAPVVDRIVEKPIDRVVEKLVDNPAHLSRITALEGEVATIAALKGELSTLKAAPPVTVEKIVEKIVEKPVDRIVEKIVEKPVDRVVEKVVEKMIDNPVHLARIKQLETDVAAMGTLRSELQTLKAAPPKTIEKIVEKPVDRIVEKIVEKPVDRIVEKIVEKPVDRVVEKVVEKLIDNPAHLATISSLQAQVATIAGLQATISTLKSAPPVTVEKIVEKPVDRIVEKIVEKPVDRIVEKIVEKPVDRVVEKLVPDTKGLAERDAKLAALQQRFDELDRRIRTHETTIGERDAEITALKRAPALNLAAARAAGFSVKSEDDLEIIEGIGPKIAELLRSNGIRTFAQLANTEPSAIRTILDAGGPNFRISDPGTWPEQADLAARNRWTWLKSLQDTLVAGVRVKPAVVDAGEVSALKSRLATAEDEIKRLTAKPAAPAFDRDAAKAAGFDIRKADDLEVIEGIGPKIAGLFYARGINTFLAVSQMTPAEIQPILDAGGPNFKLANPASWPQQAGLAAFNKWTELKALQDSLTAGNR